MVALTSHVAMHRVCALIASPIKVDTLAAKPRCKTVRHRGWLPVPIFRLTRAAGALTTSDKLRPAGVARFIQLCPWVTPGTDGARGTVAAAVAVTTFLPPETNVPKKR
jgi:hypothetical protein